MANTFKLEIITPTRKFLSAQVEAITVLCPDGELTVLAKHAPMVASLAVGELHVKIDGEWKTAFQSEGFLEVRPDEVIVFSQACEWPEEIDARRAEEAKERALEKLRQKTSIYEHRQTSISLARAMMRLKVKHTQN